MEKREYYIWKSPRGWIFVLGSARGLVTLTLPCSTPGEASGYLGEAGRGAVLNPGRFEDLARRLDGYFLGRQVSFGDELDLSGATPFQRKVWEAARHIPAGETRSYGWLAQKIGRPKGARAVGQALRRNPLPIIVPCHRVIASRGGLGGFSAGSDWKKELLKIEAGSRS